MPRFAIDPGSNSSQARAAMMRRASGGIAGSAIGTRAARALSADKGKLNMIFAGFVMIVAFYMLWKSWAELAG